MQPCAACVAVHIMDAQACVFPCFLRALHCRVGGAGWISLLRSPAWHMVQASQLQIEWWCTEVVTGARVPAEPCCAKPSRAGAPCFERTWQPGTHQLVLGACS